eukprot:g3002.t1
MFLRSTTTKALLFTKRSQHTLALSELTAISGVDGRYGAKAADLRPIFSEYGLIKSRVAVEVSWMKFMAELKEIPQVQPLSAEDSLLLDTIVTDFNESDAKRVKEIERTTNHDVKAVEYFLKERATTLSESLATKSEWWHFACTSEDINNLAYGMMLREAREKVMLPAMDKLLATVSGVAHAEADSPLLARTHGQPATPTTVGKEMANFAYRLQRQRVQFEAVEIQGKFNGAVGNYNAHIAAYPQVDWPNVAEKFVSGELGLSFNPYTTQIEPHDMISELFDSLCRFNRVLLDLDRDLWGYISQGYFKQRAVKGEVGSSTMPHKVNPIDFENSEGNIGLANAIMTHLGEKLPVSRYQRDLSDSTVLRSIGVGFAHSLIAYKACMRGLSRIDVNKKNLDDALNDNWEVLAEPIQTVMRKHDVPDAYEKLKALTRGERLGKEKMQNFVESLRGHIPDDEVDALLVLTPQTYIGAAPQLARAV